MFSKKLPSSLVLHFDRKDGLKLGETSDKNLNDALRSFGEWFHINAVEGHPDEDDEKTLCNSDPGVDDTMRSSTTLGTSLVELEIHNARTSQFALDRLLVTLPKLRRFSAYGLQIETDPEFRRQPCTPSLSQGGEMSLLAMDYSKEKLDWIPVYASFSKLSIGAMCVVQCQDIVEQWIHNSAKILKHLRIDDGPDGMCALSFL